MIVNSKCPTCRQAVPVHAMQKFTDIPPTNTLAGVVLTFRAEDRNVDLGNLRKLCTDRTPVRWEASCEIDGAGDLVMTVKPIALSEEELAKSMPSAIAASRVADLITGTTAQLQEKCVELGIEFYPKAKDAELRSLIEGEMKKREGDPKRGGKPKPEPAGVR